MKILFPYYPLANSGYPAAFISDGMVASSEHQINALVEAGYDVTLLTSRNFPVKSSSVKHIVGKFPSKEDVGQFRWKEFTQSIIENAEDYDLIWLNSAEIRISDPTLREQVKRFAHKIVIVFHHYDDIPFSSFLVTIYQTMAWVLENGGRVAPVSKTFADSTRNTFELKPDIVANNPYHDPALPTHFVDKFEWFNNLYVDSNYVSGELDSTGDFVVLGRCSKEKRLEVGIKAFIESKVKGNLFVFTNTPQFQKKQQEYFERIRQLKAPNVIWCVDEPREKLFKVLRQSSVLIFPSSKEASPLTPQEAMSCGMKVIYRSPNCWFVGDAGIQVADYRMASFRDAIRNVTIPTLEEKERIRDELLKRASLQEYAKRMRKFIEESPSL